jgi:hypothetical protein
MAWVVGAVIPVAVRLGVTAGGIIIAVVAIGAGVVFALGGRPPVPAAMRRRPPRPDPTEDTTRVAGDELGSTNRG